MPRRKTKTHKAPLERRVSSISEAQKGRAITVGKIVTNPKGKIQPKSIYGPWQFSHFGQGSLSKLGKKIYRDGHR